MAARNTLGSLVIEIGASVAQLRTDMQQATSVIERGTTRIREIAQQAGRALAAVGTGLAASLSVGTFRDLLNAADQFDELAQKTGIATEELSQFRFAAEINGVALDKFALAQRKLSENLTRAAGGDQAFAAIFRALDIEVRNATGQVRSFQDVLPEISDRFRELQGGSEETALAIRLFGEEGVQLLTLLNQGGAAINRYKQEAQDLGLVLDGEAAAAAGGFNENLERLQAIIQALGVSFVNQFAVPLRDVSEAFVLAARRSREFEQAQANGLASVDSSRLATEALARTLAFTGDVARNVVNAISVLFFGFLSSLEGIRGGVVTIVTDIQRLFGLISPEDAAARYEDSWARFEAANQGVRDSLDTFINAPTIQSALEETLTRGTQVASAASEQARVDLQALVSSLGSAGAASASAAKAEADKLLAVVQGLQFELSQLSRTEAEQRVFQEVAKAGVDRYSAEGQAIAQLVAQIQQLQAVREADKKAAEDAAATQAKLLQDAASVIQRIQTPQEALNAAVERYNELRAASVLTEEQYARAVTKAQDEFQRATEQADERLRRQADAARELGLTFSSAFEDAIVSARSFSEVLQGLQQDIVRLITRQLVTQPLADAVSGFAKSFDFGSIFGNLFGGARATGGPVSNGRAYLVGERGPELFVPSGMGQIVPNDRLAAAAPSSPTVIMNITTPDANSFRRSQKQLVADFRRALG